MTPCSQEVNNISAEKIIDVDVRGDMCFGYLLGRIIRRLMRRRTLAYVNRPVKLVLVSHLAHLAESKSHVVVEAVWFDQRAHAAK